MSRPPAQNPNKRYTPTGTKRAAAMVIAVALGAAWEGRRNYAYDDKQPWVVLTPQTKLKGVLTVCDGHTDRAGTAPPIVIGRYYSDAECDALSEADHKVAEAAVIRCNPELFENPHTAGAIIDFAYNVGGAQYCGSTLSKDFRAGKIELGCQRLLDWKYQDRVFKQGLLNRRKAELATCVTELDPA